MRTARLKPKKYSPMSTFTPTPTSKTGVRKNWRLGGRGWGRNMGASSYPWHYSCILLRLLNPWAAMIRENMDGGRTD